MHMKRDLSDKLLSTNCDNILELLRVWAGGLEAQRLENVWLKEPLPFPRNVGPGGQSLFCAGLLSKIFQDLMP